MPYLVAKVCKPVGALRLVRECKVRSQGLRQRERPCLVLDCGNPFAIVLVRVLTDEVHDVGAWSSHHFRASQIKVVCPATSFSNPDPKACFLKASIPHPLIGTVRGWGGKAKAGGKRSL